MQAAHGWLEQEAQGEAADGKMNDNVKLAFPEWVSPQSLGVCGVSGRDNVFGRPNRAYAVGVPVAVGLRALSAGHLQIHHTAWKGKGDVYHLVFDVTQFIYGGQRTWQINQCLQRSSCTIFAQ
jgi:hypothetical protein